jgi:uncharacterized membrane protein YdjX (TVP38/TMEM64 family)
MSVSARVNRYANLIKGVSLAIILVAVILLVRALPVDSGIQLLQVWIQSLGIWGPVIYALVYAVAATLFFPGSAMTLAAGAVFGLGWGTLTVWVGATGTAALSFLIARYVARKRVAEWVAGNPKFSAIDRAIGERGWKIVALLRLSPAVPFNLQNYLYGLTAIGFWPCLAASAVFMLPGTFMYVYLGHLGGQGLAAAAGADAGSSTGQWVLRIVGLLATVAVTVYITRFAKQAIREVTDGEEEQAKAAQPRPAGQPQGWPWGATVTAGVAVLLFSSALYAYIERDSLRDLFGPPPVVLSEAYQPNPAGPTFDHSRFDSLLRTHVDEEGWVDYEGLREDSNELDAYIAAVAKAPFDEMGRNGKLALLINAYNAFTFRLILDYYPLDSIFEIPSERRWDDPRWDVGGYLWSLSEIEHEQIRPKFIEPRIHFALVCAAEGCPKLVNEAYQADRLEEQLTEQARYVHSHDRWFRFDEEKGIVHLTQLYNWYGGDFVQTDGSVIAYAARYSPELQRALDAGEPPTVRWLHYDWGLNRAPDAR